MAGVRRDSWIVTWTFSTVFGYHQFPLGRRKGLNIKIVMLIYFAAPQLTNSDLTSTSVLHHFLAFLSLLKYDFEDPDKPRG